MGEIPRPYPARSEVPKEGFPERKEQVHTSSCNHCGPINKVSSNLPSSSLREYIKTDESSFQEMVQVRKVNLNEEVYNAVLKKDRKLELSKLLKSSFRAKKKKIKKKR